MKGVEKILDELGTKYLVNEPMSLHTTFRIGGNADYYIEIKESEDLKKLVTNLSKNKINYHVIGWGSNILVSDDGIRGVVIRNKTGNFEVLDNLYDSKKSGETKSKIRLDQIDEKERGIYSFVDLDYDESGSQDILVRVSSGFDMPKLITETIERGITGLQWYAGIPGTVGGGVYNNIHGGTHLLEEVFDKATAVNPITCETIEVDKSYMKFDYDESYIHETKDIIIDVILRLKLGDKGRALYTAREWYKRKAIQPRNTPGCVWKNISEADKLRLNLETTATGYLIDQKLGWRGTKKEGGAFISDKHANFIENTGHAKAKDVLKIMKDTKDEIWREFHIKLESEIIFMGFGDLDENQILESVS